MVRKTDMPRKPLRQRVAERRAGIKPEEAQSTIKWRNRLTFLSRVLQGVALVMLLIYLFQYMTGDVAGLNYMVVGLYALLFVIGRAIKIGVDIQKASRK